MACKPGIAYLENPVKDYAWGSRTTIPQLLGKPNPQNKPQAELWMGAHPSAPSRVITGQSETSLLDLIDANPDAILGKRVAGRFGGKLPFLFKVLAAAEPLSIQAHPNIEQAAAGFTRENAAGIPLTAPNRTYKDSNHKPEIICALTDFWAMRGFRPYNEILSYFEALKLTSIRPELDDLAKNPGSKRLAAFYAKLMHLPASAHQETISAAVAVAERKKESDPALLWVTKLHTRYPLDIGLVSPMLLNVIRLNPGEALYLPAGVLHAYLEGAGMELMANSDNVLRGGLTPKHVDTEELLRILQFEPDKSGVLQAHRLFDTEGDYPSSAQEFHLSVIKINGDLPHVEQQNDSVKILFCAQGRGCVRDLLTGEEKAFDKGRSILIPACVGSFGLQGQAVLYKAGVPR